MPRFYETTLSITNLHNLSISTHVNRSRIGFDITQKIIDYVNSIMSEWSSINYAIKNVDVTDRQPFSEAIAA